MSSYDDSGPISEANITQITPFLFLGDKRVAQDKEYLKEKGLCHVVNATSEIRNYFESEAPFRYFQCPVADTEVAKLSPFLPGAVKFIQDAIDHGHHVLVHCRQGVSRSATVIIAYLMKYQRLKLSDAYSQVRMKRAQAKPNANFLGQLALFEKNLDQEPSVAPSKKRVVAAAEPPPALKRARSEGPALPPGYKPAPDSPVSPPKLPSTVSFPAAPPTPTPALVLAPSPVTPTPSLLPPALASPEPERQAETCSQTARMSQESTPPERSASPAARSASPTSDSASLEGIPLEEAPLAIAVPLEESPLAVAVAE
jgi:hypothetical protein